MDTIQNVNSNIITLAKVQENEFKELKAQLNRIESNQAIISANIEVLSKYINDLTILLSKKLP